jgi:hypothetical protein
MKIHRLGYGFSVDFKILNPYPWVWFSCWESRTLGESLKLFGLGISFLRFLKSTGWYGFSYGFLLVLNVFHQCLV